MTYEYRVIPSPVKGVKAQGVKTPEARFARSIEQTINDMAKDDWEYVRAETLPAEERVGLTSKVTRFHNMLVFRRVVENATEKASIPHSDDTSADEALPEEEPVPVSADASENERSFSAAVRSAAQTEAAKKLVATPPDTALGSAPKGQMMGILRTIKGDRVAANSGSDLPAPRD